LADADGTFHRWPIKDIDINYLFVSNTLIGLIRQSTVGTVGSVRKACRRLPIIISKEESIRT